MKIGVIGGGVVGHATARTYLGFCDEVRVYDLLAERRTHHLWQVLDCDLIFICLPTPQKQDSLECDTSAIEQLFTGLETPSPDHKTRNATFVLRSTVPIGYTRSLVKRFGLTNLVHSPEFLTARCAVTDAMLPARNIIGEAKMKRMSFCPLDMPIITPMPWTNCGVALRNLYAMRFPGVTIHMMSSDESEAVKLFQNSFSAIKIAAFNEFYSLTQKLGLDWQTIRTALLAGGWINPMHTEVPGHTGFGFSGSCLPKDLANLLQCFNDAGFGLHEAEQNVPRMLLAAQQRNQYDRSKKC